jgi:hypothetical protein
MRKVQLYIEGTRIELFNDEQIQVTSSIQNVQDISKTYTDFSQGFTVPASDNNNRLFEHWYNSDIDFTTDNNLRKDAFIEINLTTFRKGKVQLDGANLTDGKPSSYKLTFYGEGVTLKDTFGEDLLSDLDYTEYAHEFTSDEIRTRIEDDNNTYDVKYPLITSNRIWEYQTSSPNVPTPNWLVSTSTQNDIHTTSGAINKNELFPAFRISKIFNLIEGKYGITFKGTFLQDERFTNLFLWYKGKEKLVTTSYNYDIDFTTVTPTFLNFDLSNYVNTTTNEITVDYIDPLIFYHRIDIDIISTSTAATYYIDVFQNGNYISTYADSGAGTVTVLLLTPTAGMSSTYKYQIRADDNNTIALSATYSVQYTFNVGGIITSLIDKVDIGITSVPIIKTLNLAANAPVMKIADFFSGILKTFNMTTYSITDGEYWVEPLDDWYSKGAVVDVSEYIDVSTIEQTRMPLYKKIAFKYQDSECALNKYYSTTFNKAYGDTSYQYNYDGGEFTIQLPFENLLQQKFTGTDLQVGYSLNKEFAPYVPKPVLLYQYQNLDCNFKLKNDGGGHYTIVNYTPFGQDLLYNNTDYTLNFAPETSTLLDYPIQNTLFANYYFSYLYNLYNLKQRLTSVKAKLPVSLLTGLELNDRLLIRDRRYIINEMKTNLTTGDVDLQLILDFRPIVNSTTPNPSVPTSGGTVNYPINFPKNAIEASFTCSNPDVSFSPDPMTESGMLSITLPSGTVGTVYTIVVTYLYLNGSTTTESFYITQ